MNANKVDSAIKVVAGLIYKDGRLLVCQRKAGAPFPLKWEFPGGKVEEGESEFDALRRELREELAIDIGAATLVYRHDHSYAGGPAVSLRFYRVEQFEGEVTNLIFEQILWCKVSELRRLDFLAGDEPIIDKLLLDGQVELFRRH
jgi:mutator protein MutT